MEAEGSQEVKFDNIIYNNDDTPKWVDEEDEQIKISLNKRNNLKKLKKERCEDAITGADFQDRLREQFTKMNAGGDIYKWAFDSTTEEESTTNESSSPNSLENLLRTNKSVVSGETHTNIKDSSILKITQLGDLNKGHSHKSIVSSLTFHPTKHNIAMTTGLDKKLKLFSIDQHDNSSSCVQTVNTIDMPIFSSKFLNESEIIISGRRKHYFVYNLENNKLDRCNGIFAHHKEINSLEKLFIGESQYAFGTNEGYILIYDKNNKTFRYDIKISGSVNSVCFDKNGINMYTVGDQSEIYVFDLRKYRHCVNKFSDSGNFNTTYMDLSKDNTHLATASNSGIVNLYSVEDIRNSHSDKIEPVKTIENLTTSCEYLKFNNVSNKLGFCSRWKKHSLKILNLDTLKVYSNFPSYTSRIKFPICFDFSANDKYLSIGNDEGKALLYRLN